ncbi:MAG: Ig-like domain-containing protein [Myxococcota bacterium]
MTALARAFCWPALALAVLLVGGCPSGDSTDPTPVDEIPKVTIGDPAQGAVVSVALIDIRGMVDDDSGIVGLAYTLNGGAERVVPQDIGRTGPFEFQVTLVKGANTITVFADDVAKNRGTASVSVTYATPIPNDAEKPKLTITDPADGAVLDEATAQFAGTATDDIGVLRLTVLASDGVERDVTKKLVAGAFAFPVDLVPGTQTIFVFAYDAAGNRSARQRVVTWKIPKTAVATLVFDESATGQTWFGAGATAEAGQETCGAFEGAAPGLMELAANELGITWLRLPLPTSVEGSEDWFGRFEAGELSYAELRSHAGDAENDDEDPLTTDPARFHFGQLASAMDKVFMPLKAKQPALKLVLSPEVGGGGGEGFSHAAAPEEYAELLSVTVAWLVATYGVAPDAIDALWQADQATATATELMAAVAAADARLGAEGVEVAWWLPSAATGAEALAWATGLPETLPVDVGLFTHGRATGEAAAVGEAADSSAVAAAAAALETWPGLVAGGSADVGTLLEDLGRFGYAAWSLGDLAVCQQPEIGGWTWLDTGTDALPAADASPAARLLGRVTEALAPGAVRVGLSGGASAGALRSAAFRLLDGTTVVFVSNDAAGSVAVEGVPAGTWTRKLYSDGNVGLGVDSVTLAAGETLWLDLTAPGLGIAIHKAAVE